MRMTEWEEGIQHGNDSYVYPNIGFNGKIFDASPSHHQLDQLVLRHLKVEGVCLTVGICNVALINL